MTIRLISHALCPYVQRAAISMREKNIGFERITIDLANKPDWFLEVSPLGKTPVLLHDDAVIFESAVILEYLEETQARPLHPTDARDRARHRGWIEFGSSILNDIAGFYSASDAETFEVKIAALEAKFGQLEDQLEDGPYFAGQTFTLVDAVFGPVFRYFDTFDEIADFGILSGKDKVLAWRGSLKNRPSVRQAVSYRYPSLLRDFLVRKGGHLASLMAARDALCEMAG